MTRLKTLRMLLAGAATALVATTGANAAVVLAVSATASSSYPTYDASDAIDTGAGSADTDWAADSTGAGSYIDLDLGASYNLVTAYVTDRVTSGGANGTYFGGTYDYTTQFTLQAYTDGSFTVTSGGPQTFTFSSPGVGCCQSPGFFAHILNVGGLDGEFIRYTVDSTLGVNPGLSNIEFATVPESSTWALMLLGVGGIGGMLRTSRRRIAAAA